MAKEQSFDVVSQVDMQEVDNAVQQASKELKQRYDLKDSGATISLDKAAATVTVAAPTGLRRQSGHRRARHEARRSGVDLKALDWGAPKGLGGFGPHHRAVSSTGSRRTCPPHQQGDP
jgi:cyclic-di-GMP-binding protein